VISTDVSDSGSIPLSSIILGLQWFRRGIRKVTEACSARAKTQTLTKSLVSPAKLHQLQLELKEMGLYQPYKPNDTWSLEELLHYKNTKY